MAFNIVFASLTLVMSKLNEAADLAIRLKRLNDLKNELGLGVKEGPVDLCNLDMEGGCGRTRITLHEEDEPQRVVLHLQNVTMNIPWRTDGRQQVLLSGLTLQLLQGQSLLVAGPSGIGKSSLLRVIAGLWSEGSGHIQRAGGRSVFFVPQKPYMSLGTLREQLLYPQFENTETITDAAIKEALRKVRLHDLLEHHSLEDSKEWASLLSLGEQQRISFARVLLQKGLRLVLMDEATSACDADNEANLYGCLQHHVSTFLSVGHRPNLRSYHTHVLWMQRPSEASETTWSYLTMAEFVRDKKLSLNQHQFDE